MTHYPLPITHYPLPITHYPLPITHYPLPITHYPYYIRSKTEIPNKDNPNFKVFAVKSHNAKREVR